MFGHERRGWHACIGACRLREREVTHRQHPATRPRIRAGGGEQRHLMTAVGQRAGEMPHMRFKAARKRLANGGSGWIQSRRSASRRSRKCAFVESAVGLGKPDAFGSTLRPGGTRRRHTSPPAPVCGTDGTVQRRDVETVFGEIEDPARALLVVVPAARCDDSGSQVEACLEPSRMSAEPMRKHRDGQRTQILPQFVVGEIRVHPDLDMVHAPIAHDRVPHFGCEPMVVGIEDFVVDVDAQDRAG